MKRRVTQHDDDTVSVRLTREEWRAVKTTVMNTAWGDFAEEYGQDAGHALGRFASLLSDVSIISIIPDA